MKECPRCLACFGDEVSACAEDGEPLEPSAFAGVPVLDGKYRLERRLGRGGMGTVYRAFHLGLGRPCAVKIIRFPYAPAAGGRSFAARFDIEARALGRLSHPHVVAVTDYGVDPREIPYLVLELLEGRTLAEAARDEESIDVRLAWLEQVAEAVDYGHAQGVLHRDLKPANVLVGPRGAKVLDFGLARLVTDPPIEDRPSAAAPARDAAATDAAGVPGTREYMAPELREGGAASIASDVYAFGVVARETLAAGRTSPLPTPMGDVLGRALDTEPARRPPRARALIVDLRDAWRHAGRRAWRVREWPRRAALAMVLAPLLAVAAGRLASLRPAMALERASVDLRFARSTREAPDPRLVLITVDEASLARDPTPLADRADEVTAGIEALFAAGAAGVAVDFLLPERWSRSPAFSRLVLAHRDALTLAAYVAPDGSMIGTECVQGLTAAALGAEGMGHLFALVNVDEDDDGVTRRLRLSYLDRGGRRYESWAFRAARTVAPRPEVPAVHAPWLNATVDVATLPRVSWIDVPARIAAKPSLVRGRLVLVGGDYLASGDDHHRVAGGAGAVSGLVLHAVAAHTALEPHSWHDADPSMAWASMALIAWPCLAGALILARLSHVMVMTLGAMAFMLVLAGALFPARIVFPITGPLLGALLGLGLGVLVRLRLPRPQ
jgi:serine/threonine protein kinase